MNRNQHSFCSYGHPAIRRCNNCLEIEGQHSEFCHTRESLLEDVQKLEAANKALVASQLILGDKVNELEEHNKKLIDCGLDVCGALSDLQVEKAQLTENLKESQQHLSLVIADKESFKNGNNRLRDNLAKSAGLANYNFVAFRREQDISKALQAQNNELSATIKCLEQENVGSESARISLFAQYQRSLNRHNMKVDKLSKTNNRLHLEKEELRNELQKLSLQYVADFGQEQQKNEDSAFVVEVIKALDTRCENWREIPDRWAGPDGHTLPRKAAYAIHGLGRALTRQLGSTNKVTMERGNLKKEVDSLDQENLMLKTELALVKESPDAGAKLNSKFWVEVFQALNEVVPDWLQTVGSSADAAVLAIKNLASNSELSESDRQRSAAWGKVVETLREVTPSWPNHSGTFCENAVKEIQALAAGAKKFKSMRHIATSFGDHVVFTEAPIVGEQGKAYFLPEQTK